MTRSRSPVAVSKAGWLFADLLLVLAIVFLSSQVPVKPPPHTAKAKRINIPVLDIHHPLNLKLPIFGSRLTSVGHAQSAFRKELLDSAIGLAAEAGRVSGVVLTFGGENSCGDVSSAQQNSVQVNKLLHSWFPHLVTSNTVTESFVDYGCGSVNTATIQMYLFLQSSHP